MLAVEEGFQTSAGEIYNDLPDRIADVLILVGAGYSIRVLPIGIALGWAAVFFIPQFMEGADRFSSGVAVATLVLVAVGGVLYTLGGVVYGLKRPNPSPRWFGFHEVFHSFTILAFAAHYVGVSLATYSLR